MDPLVIIVIAAIVVVIIGAMFLSRVVRRSVASAADRFGRREAHERTQEILRVLGTTVVLHAPLSTTRPIVDRVVRENPRGFSILDDGGYGIRFIEKDDAVVRLVDDADGTRMQVERAMERLGMPQNAEFWKELRARVIDAATDDGITAADGPQHRFARDGRDPAHWTLD